VEKSLNDRTWSPYDPGALAGHAPAVVDEGTTMLKTIRILWFIATAAMLFGFFHFVLLGTSTGARMAIEKGLAADLDPDWASWVEYTTLTAEGQIYRATLLPVTGMATEPPPESWSATAQEWWNREDFPEEGQSICVRYGQVWYGHPEGAPIYELPLGPRAKPTVIFGVLVFLAFACILVAALMGKSLQKSQAKKKRKRPPPSQGQPYRPRR
jgi:hypothetical protein